MSDYRNPRCSFLTSSASKPPTTFSTRHITPTTTLSQICATFQTLSRTNMKAFTCQRCPLAGRTPERGYLSKYLRRPQVERTACMWVAPDIRLCSCRISGHLVWRLSQVNSCRRPATHRATFFASAGEWAIGHESCVAVLSKLNHRNIPWMWETMIDM